MSSGGGWGVVAMVESESERAAPISLLEQMSTHRGTNIPAVSRSEVF